MGETSIQWTARPRRNRGPCKRGPLQVGPRCIDVTCEGCWVPGFTFNGWIGCEKPPESPECDHCYAEAGSKRNGRDLWGPDKPRQVTGRDYWRGLVRLNEKARAENQRRGVFCFSMGDVFEDRDDLAPTRARFLELVAACTHLDVMLLTKRPHHALHMVPRSWVSDWPAHVWIGATAGAPNTEWRAAELESLARLGARTFVSMEPLLDQGPALEGLLDRWYCGGCGWCGVPAWQIVRPRSCGDCGGPARRVSPSWVILGGESGGNSRPCDLAALRRLKAACEAVEVPVFVKQLGSRWAQAHGGQLVKGKSHGQDPYRWPEDLQVRELPAFVAEGVRHAS